MDEYGFGRPWKIASGERQQCSDYSLRHHTPLDPHVTSDREPFPELTFALLVLPEFVLGCMPKLLSSASEPSPEHHQSVHTHFPH
jgi:hypothetical protein